MSIKGVHKAVQLIKATEAPDYIFYDNPTHRPHIDEVTVRGGIDHSGASYLLVELGVVRRRVVMILYLICSVSNISRVPSSVEPCILNIVSGRSSTVNPSWRERIVSASWAQLHSEFERRLFTGNWMRILFPVTSQTASFCSWIQEAVFKSFPKGHSLTILLTAGHCPNCVKCCCAGSPRYFAT
jgi:hypothetical protein